MTEQERFKLGDFVNEWDMLRVIDILHEENEELKKENEQLKEKVDDLYDAKLSYKQVWKYVSALLEVSEEKVEGLEVENEELKHENKQIEETIHNRIKSVEKKYEEVKNDITPKDSPIYNPMTEQYQLERISEITTLKWILTLFERCDKE